MTTQQKVRPDVEVLLRAVTGDLGRKLSPQHAPGFSFFLPGRDLLDVEARHRHQERRVQIGPHSVAIEVGAVEGLQGGSSSHFHRASAFDIGIVALIWGLRNGALPTAVKGGCCAPLGAVHRGVNSAGNLAASRNSSDGKKTTIRPSSAPSGIAPCPTSSLRKPRRPSQAASSRSWPRRR
jgi:hypothetical protein